MQSYLSPKSYLPSYNHKNMIHRKCSLHKTHDNIIFFDWESDGLADHVGIVEKVEDGLIYTVEGNSGNRCVENRYYLGSTPVYGFGLPIS